MKLYLHIGTNKTGTSFIQSVCRQNQKTLSSYNLSYPDIGRKNWGAHHDLASTLMLDVTKHRGDFVAFEAEILSELKDHDSLLLSSESLFKLDRLDISKLVRLFQHFNGVEIIIYIREHISYLVSWYNSRIVSGDALPNFNDFCRQVSLDYEDIISKWERVPGVTKVHVRQYKENVGDEFELLRDFYSILTPKINLSELSVSNTKPNHSRLTSTVELLRLGNNLGLKVRKRHKFMNFLDKELGHIHPQANTSLLSSQAYHELQKQYQEQKEIMCRKYGWEIQHWATKANMRDDDQSDVYIGKASVDKLSQKLGTPIATSSRSQTDLSIESTEWAITRLYETWNQKIANEVSA